MISKYNNRMITSYNNKSTPAGCNACKTDIVIDKTDIFDLAYLVNYAVSELSDKKLNPTETEIVKTGIKLIKHLETHLSI